MADIPRVTKTPEDIHERVNWAMRFAQTDLETWQEDDWAQANLEVRRFLRGIGGNRVVLPTIRRMKGTREDYKELKEWLGGLHADFKYFFTKLRKNLKGWTSLSEVFELPINGTLTYSLEGQSFRVTFSNPHSRLGTFITTMLLQLADDLLRINLTQVKTCPSCKRDFLAAGKQKYDTPQCGNRERVANFMKAKAPKRQNSKKSATKI